MSEHQITVEHGATVRLPTAGKYCDRDILITSEGGGDTAIEDGLVTKTLTEYSNDRVTSLGSHVFNYFTALVSISLPLVKTLTPSCFNTCKALTDVDCPQVTTANSYAFSGCTSLTSIVLPMLKTVGTFCFSGCTALKVADFSQKVSLSGKGFGNCTALIALILRSTELCPMSASNAIDNSGIANGTGYVYVPRALLSDTDSTMDYRQATNWSTYADQFRVLEDYTVDGTITGELDETKI